MKKALTFLCALLIAASALAVESPNSSRKKIYYEAIITQSALISTISVYVDKGAYSIVIDGEIERVPVWVGALKIIPENTDFSIELSSMGGLVEDTTAIIKHVLNKCHPSDSSNTCTVTTIVRNHQICESACTFIFAAGDIRAAETDAWFGFHGAGHFDFGDYVLAPIEVSTGAYFISPVADKIWIQKLIDQGVFSKFEPSRFDRVDMQNSKFVNKWL